MTKNSPYFTVPGSERTYDRRKLLGVLLIPLAMALFQVSSVNNLLPAIRIGLAASSSSIQWVLSGYALAVGIILVASGRLGDIFGRSGMFFLGLVIFSLGSLACGFASTPGQLNAMRIVQGLGAGIYSPQVTGLIQQYFTGRDKARAFGYMGLVVSMSVAAGPILSGAFVTWIGENNGWRWSFIINAPLGVLGLVFAALFLPFIKERRHIEKHTCDITAQYLDESTKAVMPTPVRRSTKHATKLDLDPLGMALLCLTVLCLMLPFMLTHTWRWLLLILAFILGGLWYTWEKCYKARGHIPMVDLEMFHLKSFSFSVGISTFQFLGTTSVFVILAMYLQHGLGASALEVGLVGLPNALASAVAALWTGRHSLEHGRAIQVGALSLMLLSFGALVFSAWFLCEGAPLWVISPSLVAIGLSFGCMGTANQITAMLDVPSAHGGTAGGIYQTTQRVTTAIGNAVITGIFFALTAGISTSLSATNAQRQWFLAFTAGMATIALMVACSLAIAIAFYRHHGHHTVASKA